MARQEGEKVNTSAMAKWCPVPNCGRAVFAEKADDISMSPGSVVCKCGTDLCFVCMKNAHWPATCEQAKRFREKVIALKDFMDLPKYMFLDPLPDAIIVKGKSCPKCYRFIEKISGCPNMNCPCGATFCWTCLRVIKPYSAHDCVTKDQREMVVGPEVDGCDSGMKRTRFYNTALEHRKMRIYSNFCTLRSRAYAISRRLAVMAGRDEVLQNQISKLTETDFRSLQSKICKFMMRMLSMKLELHHVAEHVAVSMDNMESGNLRNKLQNVLSNLEFYVHNIGIILERGTNQNLDYVLPHLQEVQMSAQRSVSNLSRLVSPVKKV